VALGERPTQALEIANELARDPDASPQIQFEAALIGACDAYFAHRPGVVQALLARWKDPPMDLKDPVHAVAYANNLAMPALYKRRHRQGAPARSPRARATAEQVVASCPRHRAHGRRLKPSVGRNGVRLDMSN
jgi:hypothetical protein